MVELDKNRICNLLIDTALQDIGVRYKQIVADKLLTAIQKDNTEFAMLMCAYILNSKPQTRRIVINTDGEIQGNEFFDV